MSRWQPNAAERLADAALDLFEKRGYEQTTVDQIARAAGLTRRTFFRHFSDKREVLFGGGPGFQDAIVDGIAGAPDGYSALEATARGLAAAGNLLQERYPFARRRAAVIAASPELQERELVKLARTEGVMAAALRERGVDELAAGLAAGAGMAAFRHAFERWTTGPQRRRLTSLVDEALEGLRAVATADLAATR